MPTKYMLPWPLVTKFELNKFITCGLYNINTVTQRWHREIFKILLLLRGHEVAFTCARNNVYVATQQLYVRTQQLLRSYAITLLVHAIAITCACNNVYVVMQQLNVRTHQLLRARAITFTWSRNSFTCARNNCSMKMLVIIAAITSIFIGHLFIYLFYFIFNLKTILVFNLLPNGQYCLVRIMKSLVRHYHPNRCKPSRVNFWIRN